MAIYRQIAQMFLQEHKYKPITGDILTIATQRVNLTQDQALKLIDNEGVPIRDVGSVEIDASTVGRTGENITCNSFFDLFTDSRVRALDVTDYEGADIIHDLSDPLPDEMAEQHDLVFDGGCLDNLFDPAMALRSMARLVRPGGRVVTMVIGSYYPSAYLMFSPDWFYDYFVANDFADCKAYMGLFDEIEGVWTMLHWHPVIGDVYAYNLLQLKVTQKVMLVVVAEKGENSTWDKSPVQTHYRPPEDVQLFLDRARRMEASDRPIFNTGFMTDKQGETVSFAHPCYSFCGYF